MNKSSEKISKESIIEELKSIDKQIEKNQEKDDDEGSDSEPSVDNLEKEELNKLLPSLKKKKKKPVKTPIYVRIKSKEVKENPFPKRENSKSVNKLNKMPAIINKKNASTEKLKQVNPYQQENVNLVYEWNKKNAETQTEEIFFKML